MFTQRGVFVVSKDQADEETLTNLALEAGADDIQPVGDEAFELSCDPAAFGNVRAALDAAGIKPDSAEISMVASSNVNLSGDQAEKIMRLIDALEDHDDVQKVYSNFEMSEEDMARLSS
jgi:transcriptional/translational regulatory protein YebC/TACO1